MAAKKKTSKKAAKKTTKKAAKKTAAKAAKAAKGRTRAFGKLKGGTAIALREGGISLPVERALQGVLKGVRPHHVNLVGVVFDKTGVPQALISTATGENATKQIAATYEALTAKLTEVRDAAAKGETETGTEAPETKAEAAAEAEAVTAPEAAPEAEATLLTGPAVEPTGVVEAEASLPN